MAKFEGGLLSIIKAMQLMSHAERSRIISDIAKKDPQMASAIEKGLYSIKDIEFISEKMLVEFLRNIQINDFAMALKLQDQEFIDKLFSRLPKRMSDEINSLMASKKVPKRDAQACEQKVLAVFKSMIEQGKLVISQDDDYV